MANNVTCFICATNGQCSEDVQFRKKNTCIGSAQCVRKRLLASESHHDLKQQQQNKNPSKVFVIHRLADTQSRREVISGDRRKHPQEIVWLGSERI